MPLKSTVAVLLFASSAIAAQHEAEFQQFLNMFGKQYSPEEYQMRLAIFEENYNRAELLSRANNGAEFTAFNKFGDMSKSEFKSKILMNLGEESVPSYPLHKYLPIESEWISTIPSSIDWREKNAVNPVRDQGTVGTCWAFSTAGNIEGQMAIHYDIVSPII